MANVQGLSEQEVVERRARGNGNDLNLKTSRTYGEIIRRNVFNLVHTVLFILGGIFILMGRWSDAFNSAGLILVNVVIGVVQEVRAKRKLDAIAVLTRPKVTVIREGKETEVGPEEIVRGDIIVIRPGDQLVVDGPIIDGRVEMDESLLTGESDAIIKKVGDEVLSGSYCLTGTARFETAKVGEECFANRLTATAREFRVNKTPLQRQVDYVIRLLMVMAIFYGALLFIGAQLYATPLVMSVQTAAVIAGLIPVGLFFITIVSYALGAVRLLDENALIQVTNAVESLSNVDILCTDKTGTLTANRIEYRDVIPLNGMDKGELEQLLGDFARSASVTNATSEAIITGLPGAKLATADDVPFSSARKWSAVSFDGIEHPGAYVLGALEMLSAHFADADALKPAVDELSEQGLRVLVFARNPGVTDLHPDDPDRPALPDLEAIGILSFGDQLRDKVQETIQSFFDAGVTLKVISGDNPETVAALAKQAGLGNDIRLVSGPELEQMDAVEFATAAEEATVFGRITPDQKERLVDALQGAGHYVAMIGDGVNDVLSLKKAHLGVAMESGSAAARGVADIVLLGDSFGAMAPAFREGQRIVSGMQGIIRLYLARILSASLLMISVGVMGLQTPFVPTNMALYAMLTVGIPTILMALWAKPRRDVDNRISQTLFFALPAAFWNATLGVLIYAVAFFAAQKNMVHVTLTPEQIQDFVNQLGYAPTTLDARIDAAATVYARSVLTPFVVLTGLFSVNFALPPFKFLAVFTEQVEEKRMLLVSVGMVALYFVIALVEPLRHFYALVPLSARVYLVVALMGLLWFWLVRLFYKRRLLERFLEGEY